MISIFDYGAGNLQSVENALHAVGAERHIIRTADEIRTATALILPGVGHFGQMMNALDAMQARDPLCDAIRAGVPFLGICLGLQALFAASSEAPGVRGLGIFAESVQRFTGDLRVPHMGWNSLYECGDSRLLADLDEQAHFYFANSYFAPVVDATAASCEYGIEFTAILEVANLCAVQFHPEKSGAAGLRILRNFACL